MGLDGALTYKLNNMRRQRLYGLLLLILMGVSSCMGDGSDSVNYHRVGVVRENPVRCIYTCNDLGDVFVVTSPDFENRADVKDGDCCVVSFRTNFREDLGGGVYNAEINQYDTVHVWPLYETLTDTSSVMSNERLVTLDFKKSIYLDSHFFMQTQHVNHQMDQSDLFDLSYDPKQVIETDEEGQRIYNLYLRVTQEGGTGDSTRWVKTSAFTIDKFLDQAKATENSEGLDIVNFKVNYVSGFNADTTACVWGTTDIFTLRFTN